MRLITLKIASIFCITILLSACNATKRVPDNAYLLDKTKVLVNDVKTEDAKIDNFILQKPNGSLLGMPLGLYIYNLAKENPEQDFVDWLEEHPRTHKTLDRLLSQKQVGRLQKSFFISGIHNQLKKIGEAPVILDNSKTKSTVNYLKAYYRSIGYFNATVRDSVFLKDTKRKKQLADVSYIIKTGEQYFIDDLKTSISSSQVDSVYHLHRHESLLKSQKPYLLADFNAERSRLTNLFRNNGFYTFQQSSINFEITRDTIATNNDQKMDVVTVIDDLIERDGDEVTVKPYRVHRFNKIRIFTDYEMGSDKSELDSIDYKNVTVFYKNKLRYRPRILEMATAFKKGAIYSDENRSLTYKQINNLRIFKYPNIDLKYAENDSLQTKLDANIYLLPMDKFSLRLTNELKRSEIEQFGISLGTSVSARNLFRRSEVLELNLQGTIASQFDRDQGEPWFNMSELGADVRLIFPEIVFLFNTTNIIPYSMTPQTMFQFGVSKQKNIGLDKQTLSGALRYTWNPKKNRVILDLFNLQYIHNLNVDNFFNVYRSTYSRLNEISKKYSVDSSLLDNNGDLTIPEGTNQFMGLALWGGIPNITETDLRSTISVLERANRLTYDDFILSTSYTFILNNNFQFNQEDFYQFRVKLESAGSFLSLLSNAYKVVDSNNKSTKFLDVEFAQYVKMELDYIKHFPLGRGNYLAFRSFFGLAVPYGNSKNIPFTQSYFAGGSSDNRGWRAYSLGPGQSGSLLDFNEANMKLTLNLEYRFPISGAFKGALFADAGNIWNVLDNTSFEQNKFKDISSLKDVGVSSGVGLRYDFGFFVFRLDLGNKIYNPAKAMSQRWFTDVSFKNIIFNIGINYPF